MEPNDDIQPMSRTEQRHQRKEMKKAMDADEIGGTAFLGISKPVIKAHGSSKANAIFAAIRQAKVFSESGFTDEIKENIDLLKIDSAEG